MSSFLYPKWWLNGMKLMITGFYAMINNKWYNINFLLLQGCFYLKSHWEERNGIVEKVYHRCGFFHVSKVIRFYNPDDLKDCRDIQLCEMHFHEVFDHMTRPLVIAEDHVSQELKKIAEARKGFREKQDWEMLRQYNSNPMIFQKVDHRKKYLRILQETCRHEDCENSTKGRARQLFSISILNMRGGSQGKLNFCSYECWNKIRKYVGFWIPRTQPKLSSLESYM